MLLSGLGLTTPLLLLLLLVLLWLQGFVKDRPTLLDVSMAGPLWGVAASGVLLLSGLGLTAAGLGDSTIDSAAFADSFIVGLLGQVVLGEALVNPEVRECVFGGGGVSEGAWRQRGWFGGRGEGTRQKGRGVKDRDWGQPNHPGRQLWAWRLLVNGLFADTFIVGLLGQVVLGEALVNPEVRLWVLRGSCG
jgi:hypothetical protein